MPLRYWLLIILLGAVWGCSFLFNAILIREISPLWVAAGRGQHRCADLLAGLLRHPQEAAHRSQALPAVPHPRHPELRHPLRALPLRRADRREFHRRRHQRQLTPMTTVIVSQLWPGGEKATWNKVVGRRGRLCRAP